ncbi:hypothetical protein M514_01085 [Trichuris suis]|uniref:Uncharacterized protein n=1 Tax=Trichuris suis TaxID=68888 RepID=A0A085MS16_9BILA|nr:hypothetical protein M513_01085 [Trichuris suis]KFD60012.1 hypothetical protein M514_01085 [Trichuris suis]
MKYELASQWCQSSASCELTRDRTETKPYKDKNGEQNMPAERRSRKKHRLRVPPPGGLLILYWAHSWKLTASPLGLMKEDHEQQIEYAYYLGLSTSDANVGI